MKISLTEKQLETILDGLDFWQGSLEGVEEYSRDYRKAEKMLETLQDKARKARAEEELERAETALAKAHKGHNINDPQQVRELELLKMRVKVLKN